MDKGELGKALDNSYKNAQDVASDKYINPTARFQGSIVKDVNGHDHRDRVRTGIVRSVSGEYKKTGGQQWKKGLQGLLMGAVLVMFLIAMESALQVVDSSEALEQTVEERMMEQRTITVQRISEKESDVFGWMKYLEE